MKLPLVAISLAAAAAADPAGVGMIGPWDEEINENLYADEFVMEEADHWIQSSEDYLFNLYGSYDHLHQHPYFQRSLKDANGNLVPPTTSELADLLLEEMNHEKEVNGTVDPGVAMSRVAEQILAKAGTDDNATIGELTAQLVIVRKQRYMAVPMIRT